jgi:TolB-like protein
MGNSQPSIAVLAFEDLSPQKDQDYFCDGIAEEIINHLAKMEGIRVASRTSSFAYKGQPEDIRNIGKNLDVKTVLEGSVRKADDRLRITTQLFDVSDGCHLWSEQFDRQMADIYDIQLEIARSITQTLKIKLSDKEKHAVKKVPTDKPLRCFPVRLNRIQAMHVPMPEKQIAIPFPTIILAALILMWRVP